MKKGLTIKQFFAATEAIEKAHRLDNRGGVMIMTARGTFSLRNGKAYQEDMNGKETEFNIEDIFPK